MATHGNTQQHTTTHGNTPQNTGLGTTTQDDETHYEHTLQYTATQLQHTATYCSALQFIATAHPERRCNTTATQLPHTATHQLGDYDGRYCHTFAEHCSALQNNTRQLFATPPQHHCNTLAWGLRRQVLQRICNKLQHTATQHVATHCNTLQHNCNTLQQRYNTTVLSCSTEPTGVVIFLRPDLLGFNFRHRNRNFSCILQCVLSVGCDNISDSFSANLVRLARV